MAPTTDEHRRTHNLLLLNNLLNQLTATSPFTLVLDTLEQTSRPLIDEYAQRANDAKIKTVLISFETLKKPEAINNVIHAWNMPASAWQKQIATETASTTAGQRTLLIIDSLNAASATLGPQLAAVLSSLLSPTVSMLAVYHTDIQSQSTSIPSTLSLMSYLATTVLIVHSLRHVLAKKAARDRSVAEPAFGLDEGIEGVIAGLGSNSSSEIVLEMEHRRKSGRGVKEWFVLQVGAQSSRSTSSKFRQGICLLEDYPGYRAETVAGPAASTGEALSTFELGLTDRQRQDREGVVLPYFDAQKGEVEGGRILYDMGAEDDFDEEEDEI